VKRNLGTIVTAVVAAAVVALLTYGLTTQGTNRALDEAVNAGRHPPAPEATRPLPVLDGVGGATASLSHWRGGVVVVNFWASWCSSCSVEAPLLEKAQRMLAEGHSGTVVGVTYKDITGDSLASIKSFGLSYPNLRDVDGSFAAAYGTEQLPETFVLNRRLRVVAISRGPITQLSWLTGAISKAEQT
jgi:thiol-disulfide isomerase/thioredoxin